MTEKKSKNNTKSSSTTKKKRVTISIFGKKLLIGLTLCTLSAAAGAGIAYGVTVATSVSNNASINANYVKLYSDSGNPVSMVIGSSTNSQSFTVPEDSLPTLNNYVNNNASYLTLSLVFPTLEFTFTNETTIEKNNISFNLILISDVANAAPTTLNFSLNNDSITVPAGKTLSFTNLVFDFKVDICWIWLAAQTMGISPLSAFHAPTLPLSNLCPRPCCKHFLCA